MSREKDISLDSDVSLYIELEGLFFYNTKCGPRWLLRKVVRTDPNDLTPDKQDIDSQWERDTDDFLKRIEASKENYIKYCEEMRETVKVQWDILSNETEMSEKWGSACEELARLMKSFKGF